MKYKIYTIEFLDVNGTTLRKEKIISNLDEDLLKGLLHYSVDIVGCEEYKGKLGGI